MPSYCLNAVVTPDRFDLLIAQWQEFGMLGCEELNSPEGLRLKVYFKNEFSALQAVKKLNETGGSKDISVEAVEDRDWNAKWRESMKPAKLAAGWYVSPVWLPPPRSAKQWIKIEPKMAFGTGHHETTRLAAQAIIAQKRLIKGRRILDIGTGSGVLCFVAGLCGARSCVGIEIDYCCRENLAENRGANAYAGKTAFAVGSINCLKGHDIFDVVVMNMLLTESAPLLGAVSTLLAPASLLVWSGILADEYRDAVEIANRHRFSLLSEKKENEWWCGTFEFKNTLS
ncbi:MAG: 50S ribosomal protein L11 methyltransferase [Chitinispirillaceae bacterium]|nr:50S ribosomal protein L11 methyltransferase [Chitinispirillaceae bacterium]